jgi:bifunctional DNA-binding transcriptional regulator/antitoxin component of YhaV-PrlF toxin-antitoxin module
VTLPIEWRKRYGLEKGDFITFEETEDGKLVISPKQAQMIKLLDEIGEALKEKGITLDEMIESGREIRGQMLKEKYGIDPDD